MNLTVVIRRKPDGFLEAIARQGSLEGSNLLGSARVKSVDRAVEIADAKILREFAGMALEPPVLSWEIVECKAESTP